MERNLSFTQEYIEYRYMKIVQESEVRNLDFIYRQCLLVTLYTIVYSSFGDIVGKKKIPDELVPLMNVAFVNCVHTRSQTLLFRLLSRKTRIT